MFHNDFDLVSKVLIVKDMKKINANDIVYFYDK